MILFFRFVTPLKSTRDSLCASLPPNAEAGCTAETMDNHLDISLHSNRTLLQRLVPDITSNKA